MYNTAFNIVGFRYIKKYDFLYSISLVIFLLILLRLLKLDLEIRFLLLQIHFKRMRYSNRYVYK